MTELFETIASLDVTIFKVLGMIFSGFTGVIMSWLSKRSVNYRKIDKSVVVECIVYFVILNVLAIVIIQITAIAGFVLLEVEIVESFLPFMFLSVGMSLVTIGIFWGLIIRTKIMKRMMTRAKGISKRLFLLINGISIFTVILSFVYLPFIIVIEYFPHLIAIEGNLLTNVVNVANWVCNAWWFALIISFVWRTAKYVYSEMKITLLDGEVIQYSCSPQMCRVHKSYIRLLQRDDKGKIIYERHISEGAVKQIEYLSEVSKDD